MQHVKTVKLGDIIENPISGEWGEDGDTVKVLRSTNFTNDGYLNLKDVVTRHVPAKKVEQKQLRPGDTIIEKSGGSPNQPVGRVVYFDQQDGPYLCSNFTSVIRPKSDVTQKYLFWFLFNQHAAKNTLKYQNKTTGIINLQLSRYLDDSKIPLPDLDTQRHIAAVLDRADALRQKDRQLLAYYEQLPQAVFLEMFGDNKAGLWKREKIENVAMPGKTTMRTGPFGSDLLHSEFVQEGIAVLGIDNVVSNYFEWAKPRFITRGKYEKLKRYKVHAGDVLISIMGTTGRSAVVPKTVPEAINSKHLAAITPNHYRVNPYFLHHSFLYDKYVRWQLVSQSKGAIMDGLNLGIIKSLAVLVPPLALQTEFAQTVEAIEKQKAVVKAQLASSEALFQSLLHGYFGRKA
jgi:type I restriction enzyme, S subunit